MLTPNQAHQQQKVSLKKWKAKQPAKLVLQAVNNHSNFNT